VTSAAVTSAAVTSAAVTSAGETSAAGEASPDPAGLTPGHLVEMASTDLVGTTSLGTSTLVREAASRGCGGVWMINDAPGGLQAAGQQTYPTTSPSADRGGRRGQRTARPVPMTDPTGLRSRPSLSVALQGAQMHTCEYQIADYALRASWAQKWPLPLLSAGSGGSPGAAQHAGQELSCRLRACRLTSSWRWLMLTRCSGAAIQRAGYRRPG
jgi:hypothetical protein